MHLMAERDDVRTDEEMWRLKKEDEAKQENKKKNKWFRLRDRTER